MNCSPKLCVLIKIEEDLCDTRVSNYISAFLNKPFGEIKWASLSIVICSNNHCNDKCTV